MSNQPTAIQLAFRSLRGGFIAIGLFSLVINLTMLADPLYMMQVYDRVLTSQSFETLIALSLLLAGVFIAGGFFDLVRMRILNRLAADFDTRASGAVFDAAVQRKISGRTEAGDSATQDLGAFRDFLSNNALIAFFDAPWVPIYLAILFILHPILGVVATSGAIILFVLAFINDRLSNKAISQSHAGRRQSDGIFDMCERNAESVQAMGMKRDMRNRWTYIQSSVDHLKTIATDRIATFSIISKTFRLALQSAILGVGAALAISGESTAGVMIAATIILGRALAPVDQVIGQWRVFKAARIAYQKLNELLEMHPPKPTTMSFPKANKTLEISIRQAGSPTAENAHLIGISGALKSGDVAAIIGPSGSGKSTLSRMIAGVWTPQRGEVCLDGIATDQWNDDELGAQIGYLPQDIELFDGTVRENIARFSQNADNQAILDAAIAADVHQMILQLPEGYDTRIGPDGKFLSGGQRQRIGLARALYNDPFLLVLDEPNANLDATGNAALKRAIMAAQARGAITVVVTHKPSTLEAVNKILLLENGRQKAFGPKEEILEETAALSQRALPASVTHFPKRANS